MDPAPHRRPSCRASSRRCYLGRKCEKSVKKNQVKPWLNKRWCLGKITGDYIWHLEDVLYQYARPSDPLAPLLCYDERPGQLLGDVLVPLPMKPGRPQRYDHEYERHGTCCVLLAFEPHTGFRYVQVRDRRTAADYAPCMQNLLHLHSPMVDHIRLVQDFQIRKAEGSIFRSRISQTRSVSHGY